MFTYVALLLPHQMHMLIFYQPSHEKSYFVDRLMLRLLERHVDAHDK